MVVYYSNKIGELMGIGRSCVRQIATAEDQSTAHNRNILVLVFTFLILTSIR